MNFNFNVDPNMRQRRRSNLGKRHKNGEKPPQLVLGAPAIPKTVLTGLGRSRSAKKNCFMDKASKEYITGIKKKLFQRSPQTEVFLSNDLQGHRERDYMDGDGNYAQLNGSISLNMTGIRMIGTPSPDSKSTESSATSKRTINFNIQQLNKTEIKPSQDFKHCAPSISSFSSCGSVVASPRIPAAGRYSIFNRLEPPKSPGPSQYHQLIMKELANIKPPVDRPESLRLGLLSLEDVKSSSESPPALGLVTSTSIKQPLSEEQTKPDPISSMLSPIIDGLSNSDKKPDKTVMSSSKKADIKLDVIMEDNDSTDSYEMAERTILNQCRTLEHSNQINKSTTIPKSDNHSKSSFMDTKNTSANDEELEKILEEIELGLEDMRRVERRMRSLKTRLQCLLKNRQQSNNDTVVENKENMSVNIAKDQNSIWINSLKHENPGLLKTPKPNHSRLSFADQSCLWTPHSLSTVLHEQVGDLFDC
uniref:Uncharacterized protein n=1 Tax=Graphocephala atropunctata TaxID=36148 RepID=A0A1B6M8T0_9HEMI